MVSAEAGMSFEPVGSPLPGLAAGGVQGQAVFEQVADDPMTRLTLALRQIQELAAQNHALVRR